MQDEELAEAMLTELRDAASATRTVDLVEVGRARGVDEHYQIQRVAERLREQGLIEDMGFSGQSMLARITERGIASLRSGDFRHLTERAVSHLEQEGRTAEARGE